MQMQQTAGNIASRQRLSPVKKSKMCQKMIDSNTKDRSEEKTYRQGVVRDPVVHSRISGFDSQQCTAKKSTSKTHINYSPIKAVPFKDSSVVVEPMNQRSNAIQGSIINEVCLMPLDKTRQKSREKLCNDLMQSIHQLSNSQLLQNISHGSSSNELKEPAPLSPSKYDYNSAQQSKGHSRAESNFTQNSKVNAKSSASFHSVSPSINSSSPKKRRADKENQENDEPLIVSARNFIRTEAIGEVLNPSDHLKNGDSYHTSPCKSKKASKSPQKIEPHQTFRAPHYQQDDDSVLQGSQTVSLPISPNIDQTKVTSVSPTKFERYLKIDKQSLVNPFKPSAVRNSVANVVKSSRFYVNRADTNRSKGSITLQYAGETTDRSSRQEQHEVEQFQESPDNAVKKLIKKANSKSRERYNYRMTKKISEMLAQQATVETPAIEENVLTKRKTQRRGKSDRKTSQLKSRPQSKLASPNKEKHEFAPMAPRVIEQQSDSEAKELSESDAESIQHQTFEGPVVSVIDTIVPQRACHTKQPSIGIQQDDNPIEVIEEEVEFHGQQISDCINNHEASLTFTEMQEEVLKIEQLELDLKQNLDNLKVPQVPAFTSVDSASSNVTSQILTRYAKMMDNIEEEASHSDTHSNALEAPRAKQTETEDDNYCVRATTNTIGFGNYNSTATVPGQLKRSSARTIDQKNTLHSKLASNTSEAAASCHLEERNFYEQEIGKFKADLRTLEEAEEQVRTSPSHGPNDGFDIDEDEEEPQQLQESPQRYGEESPHQQCEFQHAERGITQEIACEQLQNISSVHDFDIAQRVNEIKHQESEQIYVDESGDYDEDSNTGASQCDRLVSADASQDFNGANFPTKENSKDYVNVEHIPVELEDPEYQEAMIESERIEHAEFPEGIVGEGLFANPVELKENLEQVDRLETSPSPQKFQDTLNADHNQLNLSQLQPKDECETPEPTPHFQSSSRQETLPNGGTTSRQSRSLSRSASELSVERVFSMRIDQGASENQIDSHRDDNCESFKKGDQCTPPKYCLENAYVDVPDTVTNIEQMKEKLLEMKSESQNVSEQESYKFQLSHVNQSPVAKKSPAKTKRETTAKKLQYPHSKSPQNRQAENLKSKGKCGSAKKRLTSASPLKGLLKEQQPWQNTLRVQDSNPYGAQLSQHLKQLSPGASSGSSHLKQEQILKQKSPLRARRDRKISPGKSMNGRSPVGKDYYDPVLEANSIVSSAKKSSVAGRSPQNPKMMLRAVSNTSDVASVSTNKMKKERRSRKTRSSSNKSGTSKVGKNSKVAQQLAMNCTQNAFSTSGQVESFDRNNRELAMSQTQRQLQLEEFLVNPQIIQGDGHIQCSSSNLDDNSSPEPQPITLSQGMFDHQYGQTEITHTNFLGDGYSMMSKDFTESPANIRIPVEGLGETSPSPEREEKNKTAFKNKDVKKSPSKTSFKNPYVNPRMDTENSDRNSLVIPSKLQQQEEPILDSDDEGLLQPEMHQTSLKSAEKISLFPTQATKMQEFGCHTQVNPAQYCVSFDNDHFNNQKNLRQNAIEHAENLLRTEIKQNQYNSTSSYKSDLVNPSNQKYQRSFYGEEMNDFNPHEKMSIQENDYDSPRSRPSMINSNKKSNKKKHIPTHVSKHSQDQFLSAAKIVDKHKQEIQPAILGSQEASAGKSRSNQVPKLKVIQNVQDMLDCTEVVKQKIASKYNHTINTERSFPHVNADVLQTRNGMVASHSQNQLNQTFVPKRKSAAPTEFVILEQTQQFYSKPEDLRSKSATKIGQGLYKPRGSKSSEISKKQPAFCKPGYGSVSGKGLSSESQQFLKQMNLNATNSMQFSGTDTIQYFSNSRSSINGKPVGSNFQSRVTALNLSQVKSQTLTPILNQSYARNTLASSRKSVQVNHVCHQPKDVKPKFHVVRRTQINGTPSKLGLHQKITGVSSKQHTNLMRELQGDCIPQGLTPTRNCNAVNFPQSSNSKSKSNLRSSNYKAPSFDDPINKLTGLARIKALGKLNQQKK